MLVTVGDLDAVADCDALDDFGQLGLALQRGQVLTAAITSLNTISRAVSCDSAPLVRTVRCRTVANRLSIGLDVRRWSQCSARKGRIPRLGVGGS